MNVGPLELLCIAVVVLLPIATYIQRRWGAKLTKAQILELEIRQTRQIILWSLVAFLLLPFLPSTPEVKIGYLLGMPFNAVGLALLNTALERKSKLLAINAVLLVVIYNGLALAGILFYTDADQRGVSDAANELLDAFGLVFQTGLLLYRLIRLQSLP